MTTCDVPRCGQDATMPAYDPFACEKHWAEFRAWQKEKQREQD